MSELKIYQPIPATTLFPQVQPEPKLKCSVEWNTLIREAPRKGKENRTAKLSEPRFSIDGTDFILSDEDYDNLSLAFINKDGKVTGFPFKFPLDYYTTASPEYYDTTVYQQGVLVQLTTTTFQACKKYCVNGISSYKTLNNLVNGTIAVYKDSVLQTSGITVNLVTGVFTFSVAPSGVLTLSCEHCPNFRFDVDDLQLTQIKKAVTDYGGNKNVFKAINFRLVEDNYTKISPLNSGDWNSNIAYDLFPYATNTTYSDSVKSFIESGDNKREIRESFDIVRKLIKLESSNASWKRTQLYYTLFNVAKGRLLSFNFDTIQVRFDQDIFTSEQLGINAWTFDGLSIIETLFASSEEVKNYAHCIKIGINIHEETFNFTGPDNNVLYDFTFTSTNSTIPVNAAIYLIDGGWDTQGSIGTFSTPDLPSDKIAYLYNRVNLSPDVVIDNGPPIFIGTGNSVSGTVIEDEAVPGEFQSAVCDVSLRFVWL